MSTATKVGQVIFLQRAGVYMPAIMSDRGDLWQEYGTDASGAYTGIVPSFATVKPQLAFMLTSSRVAEGIVVPEQVDWYFNDVKLTFSASGASTNSLGGSTGHFVRLTRSPGVRDYDTLQLVKDLVAASDGEPCNIRAEATVSTGGVQDKISFTYHITITRGVSNSTAVTIAAGDTRFFAIRDKGGRCILKGVVSQGGTELTTGVTYKWLQLNASGTWVGVGSGKTLNVYDSMIQTTGLFKLEAYHTADMALIGSDTQAVIDLSDPYDIVPNPTPADETIEAGSGGSVTYTPYLVRRGETTKAKEVSFRFSFLDPAGNQLTTDYNTLKKTATVTEAMCVQAGGNVAYTITAVE